MRRAARLYRSLLNWAHQRWKIEQSYQQLKEELGLDHFEGTLLARPATAICPSVFWRMGFCNCSGREKKESWPLPTVRGWLNLLFRFAQCPHCQGYHVATHIRLFSSA